MGGKIIVVGLGPGDFNQVPVGTLNLLQQGKHNYFRTAQHPVVPKLAARNVKFKSFDFVYEKAGNFSEVYAEIVAILLQVAQRAGEAVIYAVPGHPLVAEETVKRLRVVAPKAGVDFEIVPAMSCLDAIFQALCLDPAEGIEINDALNLLEVSLNPERGQIILQVYNRQVASEVKLTLLEFYPDDFQVTVVRAAGVPGEEKVFSLPLYELDRLAWLDHLTSLYLPPYPQASKKPACYPLDPLVAVMARLRGKKGCPWDQAQTHETLKRYLIEETYEVIEAIEKNEREKLCSELGDLLLQIVFHAEIAAEEGFFNLNDVVNETTAKIIRRHPHVFGGLKLETAAQVEANWEKIKAQEKKGASLLDVPRGMPSLLRAAKVQAQAARVGFDWPEVEGVWEKLEEELAELKKALQRDNAAEIREELGDLLFTVVNVARLLGVDAEEALDEAIQKFTSRFRALEGQACREGRDLAEMSLAEMDLIWERIKNKN